MYKFLQNKEVIDKYDFSFGNYLFHTTQNKENITQARKTCLKDESEIADLTGINFEKFSENLSRVLHFNGQDIEYFRVTSVDKSLNNCFGMLDILMLNVGVDLNENVLEICDGDYEYSKKFYTLCYKENKDYNIKNVENASCPLVTVVLSFLLVIALMTTLFYYFLKKKSSRGTNAQENNRKDHHDKDIYIVSFYFYFSAKKPKIKYQLSKNF